MKISSLTLSELYEKEKITTAVEARIRILEDFTQISPTYCEKVCKLKCKTYGNVSANLLRTHCDVLIIQDHMQPKGKWDNDYRAQEANMRGIISFVIREADSRGLRVEITSLLKCAPSEEDFPNGKAPTQTKLMKCAPYLASEITRSNPKVIISLSTAVTKALGYTKASNTGNRGEVFDNKVVITLHPRVLCMIRQNASGALWGSDYLNVIIRDFRKAFDIARGTLTIPKLENGIAAQIPNIRIARSISDVKEFMRILNSLPLSAIISCDTETSSLDRYLPTAKLLCIQFGYKESGTYKALVIPLWHRKNKWFNAAEAWQIITPYLEDPDRKKVLHNMKFDVLYIQATTGVRMKGLQFDTMLLLHDIDSGTQGCYSLKTAIWDYAPELGIGGYEGLLPNLTKNAPEEIPEEEQIEEEEME